MQLEILTFCDAATEQAGRINILGATDQIHAPALPYSYARSCVVMRCRMSRIESGQHDLNVMIIDADGQPILDVKGEIQVQVNGMSGAVNMIINVNSLEFKRAGEHALEIAIDGIQLGSTPLFVQLHTGEGMTG